jgi:Ca-activated chloride channel homolog
MKKSAATIFLFLVFALAVSAQEKDSGAGGAPKSAVAVSYGIVVDNSGSYRSLLDKIVEITKDIAEENAGDDETFLVRFTSTEKIKILQELTFRKDDVHSAADEMFIEGGLTAILDAVLFSAKYLAENAHGEPARRKALILISDGDERQSKAKIEEVLKFLKDNQIRVYAFGLSDEKLSTKVLDRLTKETGGRTFVPKTRAEIPATVKDLNAALRAQ